MAILHNLIVRVRTLLRSGLRSGRLANAAAPELWCRPATVLVLRDPGRAGGCLRGWR